MNKHYETAIAKIENLGDSFSTKAAQKDILEDLNRAYELIRRNLTASWDAPFDLHAVREKKHVDVFGEQWVNVAELATLRERIKSIPVVRPVKKSPYQEAADKTGVPLGIIIAVMESLEEPLKDIEKQTEKSDLEIFSTIKEKLKEYRNSEEYAQLPYQKRNAKLMEIAGSGIMYSVCTDYPRENDFIAKVKKISDDTNTKRRFLIAKKLANHGIKEITDASVSSNATGYTGTYDVIADNKPMTLNIEIILAGGYNIQRLHTRCITKLFEPKQNIDAKFR